MPKSEKMIIDKDAIFRDGELQTIVLCELAEEQSLDTVFEIILTKGEEWLGDLPIDQNTLPILRKDSTETHDNIHQFNFIKSLNKSEKKEFEEKEILKIQTGLQLLNANQSLTSTMIQGMPDEIPELITDEIHDANKKRLNDIKSVITDVYIFCVDVVPENLQIELKKHIIDLERMFKIISCLPNNGKIKKGRYPDTCNEVLEDLRAQRDKWLRYCPSVMEMSLKVEYSKRGKKKRSNKVL